MPPTRRHHLLSTAVLATLPSLSPADTHYFVGPNNSLFSDPANWSSTANGPGGSPPANGDITIVNPSASRNITLDATPNNVTLTSIALSAGPGATLSVNHTTPALSLAVFGLSTGATYTQSTGTFTSTNFQVTGSPSAIPTYSLSGTARLITNQFHVGLAGHGSFSQSGGAIARTGTSPSFSLATQSGSSASYSLSGGTIDHNGSVRIGNAGAASFTHTGGTLGATNAIGTTFLAYELGSSASYSLSGTGLFRSLETYIGTSGSASFSQSGGSFSPGFLSVATAASSTSSYSLSAGSLTASGASVGFSGRGAYTQTGGSATFSSSLTLAQLANSTGSLSLTGGTLSLSGPPTDHFFGRTGAAAITHSGGLLSAPAGTIHLSTSPGSSASYSLSGTAQLLASTLIVGHTSTTATMTQSGGSASLGTLLVNPTGRYTLYAGILSNSTLTLSSTQSLDITSTTASLLVGTLATRTALLTTVRDYLWTGRLASTAPNPGTLRSIGYRDTGTNILVKLTYTGDANLDGQLNADDFALLDKGFLTGGTLWPQGDFNHDGIVNSKDYLLIDNAYAQLHTLAPALLSQRASQFGPDYVTQLLTSIPEPSSTLACLFLTCPLLQPSRRRRTSTISVALPTTPAATLRI